MSLIRICVEAEADVDDGYAEVTEKRFIETALCRIGVDAIDISIEKAD
jgi:hypothetical protein